MSMAPLETPPKEGENKRIMRRSGLKVFQGKPIDELTEEECKEARLWIARVTGTHYIG